MKKLYPLFIVLVFISACSDFSNDPVDYVNPFIGTGGHGHTYPGAVAPYGFVQLSPDTRLTGWDGCSGYHYTDNRIYGFSHTHLSGTGVSDYGDILFMPRTGETVWNNGYPDSTGYFSHFSHQNEKASPGYYSVQLDDYSIDVELTATEHCGFHKYSFSKKDNSHIIIDLAHRDVVVESWIKKISDTEIAGFRRSTAWARDQHVYFVAQFSEPVKSFKVKDADSLKVNEGFYQGKDIVASIGFDNPEEVLVKVGLSAVDEQGARENLNQEIPGWDFNKILEQTKKAWRHELGKIQVKGGTADQRVSFYTALYHNMIVPNVFSGVDGRYRGHDGKIYKTDHNKQYTIFSLWDTYRGTHPLYTLIDHKRVNGFIHSFLNIYKQGGRLPVWELAGNETDCMIGYHSVPVIADAIKKNIGDFDKKLALEAMLHSANLDHFGLKAYREMGCIPLDLEHESVSKTLEYAYDDWCIAQVANHIGEKGLYNEFINRAQFYKNLFDPKSNFFRARENGGWLDPFDPREVNFHHTEANAWQYTFYVPQDVDGMIKLMGGDDAFATKLDSLFTVENKTTGRHQVDITGLIGQYAHGNEPSHHVAYLYSYAGKPWQTQEKVRKIMNEMYWNGPDGLIGNEDCGQMSAWFVLSSMGFYPVNPADGLFVFGSPLFDEVTVALPNGKKFTIRTNGNNEDAVYVDHVSLDGNVYKKSFINYDDIMKGGILEFSMSTDPNKKFGSEIENRPPSLITAKTFLPKPIVEGGSRSFKKEREIAMATANGLGKVYYTVNGKEPDRTCKLYKEPFKIDCTTHIKAITIDSDGNRSYVSNASFYKMPENRTVSIKSTYSPQYSAGGDEGLIDLLRGPDDFRTGYWQGYQDQDFEATVDLSKIQPINKLALGCLQDIRSWIWMPTQIEFYLSNDGKNFKKVGTIKNTISDKEYGAIITDYELKLHNKKARFVKVIARNYGTIPDWHLGHGGEAFIFVDEIIIK